MSKVDEYGIDGNNKSTNAERLNRCRIEWQPFLTPGEYKLLDHLLFRSNLTEANAGEGWVFCVREVAKKTGLSPGFVSQKLNQWSFIKHEEVGPKFDYDQFSKWIVERVHPLNGTVHSVNGKCSLSERISKTLEVRSETQKKKKPSAGSRSAPTEKTAVTKSNPADQQNAPAPGQQLFPVTADARSESDVKECPASQTKTTRRPSEEELGRLIKVHVPGYDPAKDREHVDCWLEANDLQGWDTIRNLGKSLKTYVQKCRRNAWWHKPKPQDYWEEKPKKSQPLDYMP